MEVKVSKVRDATPPQKTYLGFEWKCTKCGLDVTSTVVENILFQYKKRSLGPMTVNKECPDCNTEHSMELRL